MLTMGNYWSQEPGRLIVGFDITWTDARGERSRGCHRGCSERQLAFGRLVIGRARKPMNRLHRAAV